MTAREKVIVGVAAGALVWAVVSIFKGGPTRSAPGGQSAERTLADTQRLAALTRTQLSAARLSPVEFSVLEGAGTEWDGKPFAEPSDVTQAAASEAPLFVYSGFIRAGDRRFAVINGREYRLHESLEGGGGTVEEIEPGHVVLRFGRDDRRQVIPFQNPTVNREKQR